MIQILVKVAKIRDAIKDAEAAIFSHKNQWTQWLFGIDNVFCQNILQQKDSSKLRDYLLKLREDARKEELKNNEYFVNIETHLLEKKSDVTISKQVYDLMKKDANVFRCLTILMRLNMQMNLKLLIIDNKTWTNANRCTLLHQAAFKGHVDTAKQLLDHHATIDALDKSKETPLHMAAGEGHVDTAKILLEHQAAVDALNNMKNTPLHYAANNGHTNTAKLLLEHQASVDALNHAKNTPLHNAANNGHTDTAILLLEYQAAVDTLNDLKMTPLHNAASNGHANTAELLLEHQAAIDGLDNKKETPLHKAAYGLSDGCYNTTYLLLENNADTNLKNDNGETPLEVAQRRDQHEIVKLLKTFKKRKQNVFAAAGNFAKHRNKTSAPN